MPVSTSVHITHALQQILRLGPSSILDVGCGFGLWGFLCREYLDVMNERVWPDKWKVRIDGIELFEPYLMAHQRFLYSNLIVGDIRELAPNVDEYDLIITGDVIEHLHKDEGEAVLEALYAKAKKALLINIPLGDGWDHPEAYGNPGELHRSQWDPGDFLHFPNQYQPFQLPCGAYGVFYCPKDVLQTDKLNGRILAAQRQERLGNPARAIFHAERALEITPDDKDLSSYVVNLKLESGDRQGALAILLEQIERMKDFHVAYLAAARVLSVLGERDRAKDILGRLLAQPGVDAEHVRKAEELRARL